MNPMTNIAESAAQAQIKELEEENRLILDQLQVVQEELERLHLDGVGSVGSQAADVVNIKWVDDELPVAMAEMARCRAILATQKEVYRLEAEHAVARKLGEILIDGVTSPKALLAVPARLLKVWRLEKSSLHRMSSVARDSRRSLRFIMKAGSARSNLCSIPFPLRRRFGRAHSRRSPAV